MSEWDIIDGPQGITIVRGRYEMEPLQAARLLIAELGHERERRNELRALVERIQWGTEMKCHECGEHFIHLRDCPVRQALEAVW